MIYKEYQGLRWLEFELLADCPRVIHGSFTRHGGCSKGALASLNFGKKVGDAIENVEANFKKMAEALSLQKLVRAKINHGVAIASVESLNIQELKAYDAITTRAANVGLVIDQADCQAAIFYDPIQHALANVHCGWRGSVQNIYAETISFMKKTYHSKSENLLVCISPSLGPESAEFINYRQELPKAFWDFQIKPYFFDFWAISRWQLKAAGILSHHIQIANIDTFSNPIDYFSHRRSKASGRQATVCALRE